MTKIVRCRKDLTGYSKTKSAPSDLKSRVAHCRVAVPDRFAGSDDLPDDRGGVAALEEQVAEQVAGRVTLAPRAKWQCGHTPVQSRKAIRIAAIVLGVVGLSGPHPVAVDLDTAHLQHSLQSEGSTTSTSRTAPPPCQAPGSSRVARPASRRTPRSPRLGGGWR